ncbi:hypothetical protein QQ045_033211 [Rhodiola kirilowii]
MKPFLTQTLLSLTFILAGISPAFHAPAAAFSANSKYEIACTMCDACENPCQPVYSPPPPSPPPPSLSPPPPPSQPTINCPPPPSPKVYPYYSPPPPQSGYVYPPPSSGGFYFPPPDRSYYPAPPPPNPIVPYFPFYFHNPPPSGNAAEVQSGFNPIMSAVIGLVIWCLNGF